jgi:hypothetical protein
MYVLSAPGWVRFECQPTTWVRRGVTDKVGLSEDQTTRTELQFDCCVRRHLVLVFTFFVPCNPLGLWHSTVLLDVSHYAPLHNMAGAG